MLFAVSTLEWRERLPALSFPFKMCENDSAFPAISADISIRQSDTVFPACGSSNSAIAMTISEIYQISHAFGWVDVCKERLI